MATLPTDFSVTSIRPDPIPNPVLPLRPPAVVPSEGAENIPTPTTLTPSKFDLVEPPFPLNHARILYENQLVQYSSIGISSGSNRSHTVVPNTWQRWSFTAASLNIISYNMGATFTADTICIGAHNLAGGKVTVFYDPDTSPGGFVMLEQRTVDTNDPIMFHFDEAFDYGRIQINIEDVSGDKFVGYISVGIALQMQRPFFSGHTPITDADVTRYYHNETESGEIIGQSIRSQGFETQAQWNNIDDGWYREYFAPFKQYAKLRPFFFAWNLAEYPDDVGFCRISEDVSAPYSGTRKLRSISMKLLGHG